MYEDDDLTPCLWYAVGKWRVGMTDEQSCAGEDFVDCRCHDPKEYDTLDDALNDARVVARRGTGGQL